MRQSFRGSLDPSLEREVFRGHIGHTNKIHYSDPIALRAFPKATQGQWDSTLYCLEQEADSWGQRAGTWSFAGVKTHLRGRSRQGTHPRVQQGDLRRAAYLAGIPCMLEWLWMEFWDLLLLLVAKNQAQLWTKNGHELVSWPLACILRSSSRLSLGLWAMVIGARTPWYVRYRLMSFNRHAAPWAYLWGEEGTAWGHRSSGLQGPACATASWPHSPGAHSVQAWRHISKTGNRRGGTLCL